MGWSIVTVVVGPLGSTNEVAVGGEEHGMRAQPGDFLRHEIPVPKDKRRSSLRRHGRNLRESESVAGPNVGARRIHHDMISVGDAGRHQLDGSGGEIDKGDLRSTADRQPSFRQPGQTIGQAG